MKTKQIFSIMVLVGIAFASIAFAGPTATPPNNNAGSPIFSNYVGNLSQSKLGAQGVSVRNALALGMSGFPTTNQSTLYVNGPTVVGSTGPGEDPLIVNSNANVGLFVVNDTIEYGTGQVATVTTTESVVTVNGLATDFTSNYKKLCVNSSGKVIICN